MPAQKARSSSAAPPMKKAAAPVMKKSKPMKKSAAKAMKKKRAPKKAGSTEKPASKKPKKSERKVKASDGEDEDLNTLYVLEADWQRSKMIGLNNRKTATLGAFKNHKVMRIFFIIGIVVFSIFWSILTVFLNFLIILSRIIKKSCHVAISQAKRLACEVDEFSIFSMRTSNGIFWTIKQKKCTFWLILDQKQRFLAKNIRLMYASKRLKS